MDTVQPSIPVTIIAVTSVLAVARQAGRQLSLLIMPRPTVVHAQKMEN